MRGRTWDPKSSMAWSALSRPTGAKVRSRNAGAELIADPADLVEYAVRTARQELTELNALVQIARLQPRPLRLGVRP